MPFKSGNPMPVTVTTSAALSGPAQPVYVVNAPPAVAGRAQRVVAVAGGPLLNSTPIPVYNAGAGALYTDDPPMPVYVVSGSLGSSAAPPSTLLNGLSLYLKNDEATGTHADASGNVTAFTNNNTVLGVPGQIGNAANLIGASSQYLSHADAAILNPTAAASWSFWVKPTVVSGQQTIAAKYVYPSAGSWIFRIDTGAVFLFLTPPVDASTNFAKTANATLTAATWAHVIAIYDSTQTGNAARLQIYVDGTARALTFTGTIPATLTVAGSAINIGRWEGANQFLTGAIDEFKLWNRAITPAEIAEDYANGAAGRALF